MKGRGEYRDRLEVFREGLFLRAKRSILMLQKLFGVAIALLLAAGVGLAADKEKKDQGTTGQLKKVDAAAGTITLAVRVSKTESADKQFTVGPDTKVIVFVGEEKL